MTLDSSCHVVDIKPVTETASVHCNGHHKSAEQNMRPVKADCEGQADSSTCRVLDQLTEWQVSVNRHAGKRGRQESDLGGGVTKRRRSSGMVDGPFLRSSRDAAGLPNMSGPSPAGETHLQLFPSGLCCLRSLNLAQRFPATVLHAVKPPWVVEQSSMHLVA